MSKKTISAALLAAIAGTPQTDAGPAEVELQERQETAPEGEDGPPAGEGTEAAPNADASTEAAADAGTATGGGAPAPATNDSGLVQYLRDETKELKARLETLTAENSQLSAANAKLSSGVPELNTIVRQFVTKMCVAMGGQPIGLETLEGQQLAEQFNRVQNDFEKRFVVGGRSKATAEVETASPTQASVDPRNQRAVKSTTLTSR